MVYTDKSYLQSLFDMNMLKGCVLVETPLEQNTWEMIIETSTDNSVQVETRRGQPKKFVTIEAATRFAHDLGFRTMRIQWGEGRRPLVGGR